MDANRLVLPPHHNHFFITFIGIFMLAILSTAYISGLGLVVSSWMLAVLALLIAGLGALLFFKFRSGEKSAEIDARAISAAPQSRPAEERRPVRPEISRPTPKQAPAAESVSIDDLPISLITEITNPPFIESLASSNDEGLIAAIEEVQDDSDADSEFRAIALRVLAGFRSRNSIEALSQIALYDLSTTLRAQAVAMLADFDHQSVFEAIVLSCADPSREVRAAGAKALFKVTFDRGDEWARFAISEDKLMRRQIARAVVEAGLAERSFDRLTMRDEKSVYEAFALVYLLVKANETEKIFDDVACHRDIKTRFALLHIMKAANVAEVIPPLTSFIAAEPISSRVADKARETILGINALPVDA